MIGEGREPKRRKSVVNPDYNLQRCNYADQKDR